MGWEFIQSRDEVLGLTIYHKLHFIKTRQLIQQCLTGPDNNLHNLRNNLVHQPKIHNGPIYFCDRYDLKLCIFVNKYSKI